MGADHLLHKMHSRSTRLFICGLLGCSPTAQHCFQLQRYLPCCQPVTAAVLDPSWPL